MRKVGRIRIIEIHNWVFIECQSKYRSCWQCMQNVRGNKKQRKAFNKTEITDDGGSVFEGAIQTALIRPESDTPLR